MTHPLEEQLVLHYYGEAVDAHVQQHLDTCEHCRTQYRDLQQVLNMVNTYPVPERQEDYGRKVWEKIQPAATARPRRFLTWFTPRHLAWAATLVIAISGAFYAGRVSTGVTNTPVAQQQAAGTDPDERILLSAVGNHLDRTQMVLLELSNVSPDGSIQASQEDVHDLLQANRLYRTTASQAGEAAVADTLDELERLLTEVAHLAPKLTQPQAQELRLRILDKGILWKLRVVGSEVKGRAEDSTKL
jgi:hypothetical protein